MRKISKGREPADIYRSQYLFREIQEWNNDNWNNKVKKEYSLSATITLNVYNFLFQKMVIIFNFENQLGGQEEEMY